jgi:hypothetical protein
MQKWGKKKMNTIELVKKYVNEYKINVLPEKLNENADRTTNWLDFQSRSMTDTEIEAEFRDVLNIGFVCGKVSGGLVVLEFSNKLNNAEQIYNEFLTMPDVKDVVDRCPVEKTPGGGYQIYFRCNEIGDNKKLAFWSTGSNKYESIIETKGEGGFCLCSLTKGYELLQGDFGCVPTLTTGEQEALFSACRTFNKKDLAKIANFKNNKKYDEKPWDLYDQSEDAIEECKMLLVENGWKPWNDEFWVRPGKAKGVLALFKEDLFYILSGNAQPFTLGKYYKPSGLYTALKYGSDDNGFKKATLDFIAMGLGKSSSTDIGIVENHLTANYDFRINVVSSKLEIKLKQEEEYHDAEDYDISSIYRELQHKEISFSYERLNYLLNSNYVTKYDPFVEYFEGLQQWDGHDYIMDLSKTIELLDETKRDFWYQSLRRYLIAMAACATQPGITNEAAITFFGAQGLGKTKWLNRLIPNALDPKKYLFVGTINDDKDSQVNISTKLLINLDELGSLNRDEIGYLKSLFSLSEFSIREPYGRRARSFTRRASFVGSIDREEFLTDLSGSRRFLSFAVKNIDYQHNIDMDRVFAQAYALYKQGERTYFNRNDIDEIEKNNEDFRLRSYEEGLLFEHFIKPVKTENSLAMTTTEIAQAFAESSSSYKITDASLKKLGQLLGKHGFERRNVKHNGVSLKRWIVQKKCEAALPVQNYPLRKLF